MGEETITKNRPVLTQAITSMEPLQHGRGNAPSRAWCSWRDAHFNGASPTWERKHNEPVGMASVASCLQWSLSNMGEETRAQARRPRQGTRRPSMEPLQHGRGNNGASTRPPYPSALQWSLSNMGEETSTHIDERITQVLLQWSLSNMGEETHGATLQWLTSSTLQWSLSNMGEETTPPREYEAAAADVLQWSLSNMGEETRCLSGSPLCARGTFNGASPTWERKRQRRIGRDAACGPSMEPLQHGRGNRCIRRCRGRSLGPSMEPLQHGRGNSAYVAANSASRSPFNGASPTWERKRRRGSQRTRARGAFNGASPTWERKRGQRSRSR